MVDGVPLSGTIDGEVFLQELHDALVHLRDLPVRHSHPLCRGLDPTGALSPAALQAVLLDAAEQLRPPPRVGADAPRSRRYRYLKMRYVEGARLEEVVAELGISERQARREHRAALQELGALLIRRPAAPNVAGIEAARETPALPDAVSMDLEAELTPLEASPDVEVICLGRALADATELVRPLAASRGVVVECPPSAPAPEVIATPTILRQILLNVLSCLVDAHAPECLHLEMLRGGTSAEIRVVPAGPRVVGDVRGAAALSLLAAWRLAEGQEVRLGTEGLASGATAVRLRFPTTAAPLGLIVDDNPGLVRMFRRYLQGVDVRLIPARNGIRAQHLIRALRPDVVILDLMMPVQDGWDLFRSLRADPDTAATPVIACSVLPERELALSLGVDAFLAKPVTEESLRAAFSPYLRPTRRALAAGARPGRP